MWITPCQSQEAALENTFIEEEKEKRPQKYFI